jgi:hypothetical protein
VVLTLFAVVAVDASYPILAASEQSSATRIARARGAAASWPHRADGLPGHAEMRRPVTTGTVRRGSWTREADSSIERRSA